MTVIPLFLPAFPKAVPHVPEHGTEKDEYEIEAASTGSHSWMDRFNARFNRMFNKVLNYYEHWVRRALQRPGLTVALLQWPVPWHSLAIYPLLGLAFFPKTDAGQFHSINPTRYPQAPALRMTDQYVAKVEDLIRLLIRWIREGSQAGRIQHRCGPRLLLALHHQLWPLHRNRAGGIKRTAPAQQF